MRSQGDVRYPVPPGRSTHSLIAVVKKDKRRGSFLLVLSILEKSCKILNMTVALKYYLAR